ncbi:hypothetical protein [Blastomonas sp.]|uniref:hypothetical protein n=1 Tax=Blastomonas sp. TaxID=1909299 RepID=UPI00391B71CF
MVFNPQAAEKHPIHGYVCPDVHCQFEAYRRHLGLTSSSSLLTLLVIREIKVKRLASSGVRVRDGQPRTAKVSAYIDSGKAQAFKGLIEQLGRSASECAADLVERELEERWLETVIEALPANGKDA